MTKAKTVREKAKEQPTYRRYLEHASYIAGLLGFKQVTDLLVTGSALDAWTRDINGKTVRIAVEYRRRLYGRGADAHLDLDYLITIDADPPV